MYNYRMIDTDEKLDKLLAYWRFHAISCIAMDFEGEFNLHIYGEHLCLVQLFDGFSYFLVDPFSVSANSLQRLLESTDIEKVMFDCASDAALVRKQYGIMLQRVHDIRLTACLLGFDGNLNALRARCLELPMKSGKKRDQKANWLKRPIAGQLIEYALSDVEHLFAIRTVLDREITKRGLLLQEMESQKTAALPKGPDKAGWEKLDGYHYLNRRQKIYVRWYFQARDELAKKLNVPPARVLDKRILVQLAKGDLDFCVRQYSSLMRSELITLLSAAHREAEKEIAATKL